MDLGVKKKLFGSAIVVWALIGVTFTVLAIFGPQKWPFKLFEISFVVLLIASVPAIAFIVFVWNSYVVFGFQFYFLGGLDRTKPKVELWFLIPNGRLVVGNSIAWQYNFPCRFVFDKEGLKFYSPYFGAGYLPFENIVEISKAGRKLSIVHHNWPEVVSPIQIPSKIMEQMVTRAFPDIREREEGGKGVREEKVS